MELEIVVRFFSEIVRLLFATGFWCAVVQLANASFGTTQTAFVIRPVCAGGSCTYIDNYPIRHVAATDQGTLVLTLAVGPDRAFHREITKVEPAGMEEPVRVRIPVTMRNTWSLETQSEGFVVAGTDWWYATLDDHDDAAATTFVKSDGSRATFVRPQAASEASNQTHSNSWQLIVIPGEKPRALEITYGADESIAREVDWSGASRWWRLPGLDYKRPSRMVAQGLPDKRIALLWNNDGLSLYLLGDEAHVDAATLRNLRIQQFDAAVDGAGRIAIVAARNAIIQRNAIVTTPADTGTIDAAIIDPAHPDHAEWSALRHDVRVLGALDEVRVVTTADGFAAAWINEIGGRRIEATDVDRRGHGGPVVEVGKASPRGDGAFLGLQAKHDELLFWWDDGDHLFQRRLPVSLKGYTALGDFAQSVCATEEGKESRRQP